jgi:hypothetical protein
VIQLNPEIRKQYADFLASVAGEHFILVLDNLIDHNHNEAEKNPELSRDFTQRAKGVRESRDKLIEAAVERKAK